MEQWLNDTIPVAVWEKKFFEIKKMQLKGEEERKLEAMREEQERILEELAEQWLSNNAKKLYIHIRYKIALEVKKDMEERPNMREKASLSSPICDMRPLL
ncbi:hypothetical protein LI012_08215 [Caldibacillus thermoamylovorans]|uniref:hypothetical protein n=1 Tax=Caldibacillus TaxID=1276290 RepID=UPI001D05F6F8|nr:MULTISPECIES: hypothetical protein [Caldibacillus]MCB5935842.1 hypothetical protein [Bacillus sp. DFI.2.34]MCB7069361.1 hypothetical protein [Caldibacillus sp. 210928-DFI.2.22]MCB7074048.1 hypothetical protein [Caldibacillus sp. 210928-DFI.2.18]MCB7076809.1 hypothetical protein [Caldibacillus thermoamylovorans]